LLEPRSNSKCNCIEWEALKEDFDADFRRIRKADFGRMELSRPDGDEAAASGGARVGGLTAANNSYTPSFHGVKGQYQELLLQLQWEKAKKRATAGGPTASGDVAASRLVFEYCDLLFKVLREQWSCFQAQYKVLVLKSSDKGPAGAGRNAGSESDKAEASERKESPTRKPPKARPKKYYAVAAGRTTGISTTWDEAGRSVSKYSGSIFKSFKHRSEAKGG
jgi:hypothetical protein